MSQPSEKTSGLTYRDVGVDIDTGNELVERIKPLVRRAQRPEVLAGIGSFGALVELPPGRWQRPVLVSGTDGVGTKLRLAIDTARHSTIGIDLVGMCVNDVAVQGAEPLFFLDYYATGKLQVEVAESVIAGIVEGCRQAGCALVGGETAEMPGMYACEDYDLAGFAVGAVERERVLTGAHVAAGDIILGLAASGVHSNGFSLVRRIVERAGLGFGERAPFDARQSLGQALLTPTRIYVKSGLAALKANGVHALAHITGGGLIENPPRVYSDRLAARIDMTKWRMPPVFRWLKATGNVAPEEMARTFNCGIGTIAIVAASEAAAITGILRNHGETVYPIGEMVPRATGPAVVLEGLDGAWRD